jgi:HEPN domain-containing protein
MRDREHARQMLTLARYDLATMLALVDANTVPDAIFGFHAQQAVEKGLKAWLSGRGAVYPRTHTLQSLFALLKNRGVTAHLGFRHLSDLTPFAVQFRYDTAGEGAGTDLDRQYLLDEVTRFLELVEQNLRAS